MKTNFALLCVLSLTFILCSGRAPANPAGGGVVGGDANATISGQGTVLTTIHQTANNVVINWQNFSIGAGEVTRFVQPSATASALNRIVSGNPSLIYGSLQANGRVFVINPNGILVGPGGQIDTKGFVASTLDVSDANFMAGGNLIFSGDSVAGVRNEGVIQALGGDVYLIAHTVENAGSISAPQGTVGMAAGSSVELMQSGNERISVLAGNPTSAPSDVGVNNAGTIVAATAELKAAGGNIYALAINNGGAVRANGIATRNGSIYLTASGGNIQNSGELTANNADGFGGKIVMDGGHNADAASTVISSGTIRARGDASGTKGGEVLILGDHVGLFDGAVVDVSGQAGGGTVLIGGDYQGANAAIHNAEAVYVGSRAGILADATVRGNGGKVVVWSDDNTRFYGSISAQGGARRGNGGMVEVSGHYLDFQGMISTLASKGRAGTLLLDPLNLIIDNTVDQNVNSATPFAPTATSSHLTWATINTALGLGNVTVTTVGSLGNEAGNITVGGASPTMNRNNTLTLNAAGAIQVVEGCNIVNNGLGGLVLNAGGAVTVNAGITLGGDLLINSASGAQLNGNIAAASLTASAGGNLGINGAIQTSSGGVTLSGADITIYNSINSGGSVKINASGMCEASFGGSIATRGGDVSISGGALSLLSIYTTPTTASAGGSVTLRSTSTFIDVQGSIVTRGGSGSDVAGCAGGDVTINSAQTLYVGAIDSGGSAAGGVNHNGGSAGNLSLTAGTGLVLNGNISSRGGAASGSGARGLDGKQAYNGGAILVGYDAFDVTLSGGAITFGSTVDAYPHGDITPAINLTVNSSGKVAFNGAIGGETRLHNLTINSGEAFKVPAVTLSGGLNLTAGGAVTQSGIINAPELQVTAAGPVSLNLYNQVGTLAGKITRSGKAFSFVNAAPLTIGVVSGLNGITTVNGKIQLTTDTLAISQVINSGNANMTLQPLTLGRNINLGSEDPNALSLTQPELDWITAHRLTIGGLFAGSVLGSESIHEPSTVMQLVVIGGSGTELMSGQFAGLLATGAVIPTAEVNLNTFTGATIDTEAAAKLLPPGSIGVLFLQLPFETGEGEGYKVEDIPKWTAGDVSAPGTKVEVAQAN